MPGKPGRVKEGLQERVARARSLRISAEVEARRWEPKRLPDIAPWWHDVMCLAEVSRMCSMGQGSFVLDGMAMPQRPGKILRIGTYLNGGARRLDHSSVRAG